MLALLATRSQFRCASPSRKASLVEGVAERPGAVGILARAQVAEGTRRGRNARADSADSRGRGLRGDARWGDGHRLTRTNRPTVGVEQGDDAGRRAGLRGAHRVRGGQQLVDQARAAGGSGAGIDDRDRRRLGAMVGVAPPVAATPATPENVIVPSFACDARGALAGEADFQRAIVEQALVAKR